MKWKTSVSAYPQNLTIYDFNCVKVLVDGAITAKNSKEFYNKLGSGCITFVSAPTEKTVHSVKMMTQLNHYTTFVANVAPLKGTTGQIAKIWSEARKNTNETNYAFNKQYRPYTLFHNPQEGALYLYVLQGDENDAEELRKAVESDDPFLMSDAAARHGLVALLVFVPAAIGSKISRVLLTGTCSGSRVLEGLTNAIGNVAWLNQETFTVDPFLSREHFSNPTKIDVNSREPSPTPEVNDKATETVVAVTPQKMANSSALSSPSENQKLPRYLSQTKSTSAKRRMSSVNTTPEEESTQPKPRRRFSNGPAHLATPMPPKTLRRGLDDLQSLKNAGLLDKSFGENDEMKKIRSKDEPLGYCEVIHLPSQMHSDEAFSFFRDWSASTYIMPTDPFGRNLVKDNKMLATVVDGLRKDIFAKKVRIVPTHYSTMVRFLTYYGLAILNFYVTPPIYPASHDLISEQEDEASGTPGAYFELHV